MNMGFCVCPPRWASLMASQRSAADALMHTNPHLQSPLTLTHKKEAASGV